MLLRVTLALILRSILRDKLRVTLGVILRVIVIVILGVILRVILIDHRLSPISAGVRCKKVCIVDLNKIFRLWDVYNFHKIPRPKIL